MRKIKIRKCSHRNAKYTFECTLAGQRRRFFFATQEQALIKREEITAEIAHNGHQLTNLSAGLRADALRSQELLDPLGASLLDAVKFYLAAHDLRSNSVSVREAWEGGEWTNDEWQSYHDACTAKIARGGLKPRCFELTRQWIPRFIENFGIEKICDVGSRAIEKWLNELTGRDGRSLATETKNTARTQLNGFFTHAVRQGWVKEDPIKNGKVEIYYDHKAATKLPGIFTPEEIGRLLEHAPSALVPYIAIGAFCGIRPAELHRLDWSDIKWERRKIHVEARKAKTAQKRDVTLPDNLLEWLAPYRQNQSGLIIGYQSEKATQAQLRKVTKAAGISKWPQDGLRHSFASYHLALHQNSALTSAEMGHMTSELVWKNYNNDRPEEEGKAFFQLRPGSLDKVIVLPAAA